MIAPSDVRRALESAGLVSGLPVAEVQARLRTGLRLADTGQRILAFYLNEMEAGRLYQASGHSSTAHYAEELLGLEPRRVRELVAVGKSLLELPAIDAAFCTQEIGWSKVLVLVSVATPRHEAAWLAKAKAVSCRELVLEAKLAPAGGAPRKRGDRKGLPEIRFRFDVRVGTLSFQRIDLAKQKLSAESGRPVNDAELLDALTDLFLRMEEDGTVPGKVRVDSSLYRIVLRPDGDGLAADTDEGLIPLPDTESAALRCDAEVVRAEGCATRSEDTDDAEQFDRSEPENQASGGGERSPHDDDRDPPTPPWLRRRVLARDASCCRSCRSRRDLMAHHIRFRSEGGKTEMRNLLTLCARCHGLVHDGLLRVLGEDAETARFLDAASTPRGESPDPDAALAMAAPDVPQPAPVRQATTLDTIPAEIDGTWWRRHSDLIHATPRGIEFEEGVPAAPAEEPAAAPSGAFDAEAFRAAFEGVAGQEDLIARFLPEAGGSAKLGRPFPHLLLAGPPGTGKTTLARAIASGCARRIVETSGPLLQDVFGALRLLAGLHEGDVLFIDEVHAVPRPVLEALYEAMAERRVSLTLQEPSRRGARVRAVRLTLPPFTLAAATTDDGELPEPFVSRFGLHEVLDFYPQEVLANLVTRQARREGCELAPEAAAHLAELARGTPRRALRLLDRVLLEATHRGATAVDAQAVAASLRRIGFDGKGLEPIERRYLKVLRGSVRPIAVARLARMLGTTVAKLLRDVEPFLFRLGLVDVGPHGRFAAYRPQLVAQPLASAR